MIAGIDGDGRGHRRQPQRRGRQPARPAVQGRSGQRRRAASRSPGTGTGSAVMNSGRPQRDQREQRPRRGDRGQPQHRRGQLRRPRRDGRERRRQQSATASTSSATRTASTETRPPATSDGVFIDGTSNTVTFNALGTDAKMTAAVPDWAACDLAGTQRRRAASRGRRARNVDRRQHRRRRGDRGGPEPTASRATEIGTRRRHRCRTATAWSWRPASTWSRTTW